MSDSVGNLEDEALKRKERLKALKRGDLKSLSSNTNGSDSELFPKPLFRNYNPKDDQLKSNILPKPELMEIRNEIKDQLDSGKPKPLIENEIDLASLAPQKVDWDLKREAEKRLKLLERRTQKAIIELIRGRLKTEKNADFAELVSVGAGGNKKRDSQNSQGEDEEEEEDDDEESEEETDQEPIDKPQSESDTNSSHDNADQKVYVYEHHEISDDDDF